MRSFDDPVCLETLTVLFYPLVDNDVAGIALYLTHSTGQFQSAAVIDRLQTCTPAFAKAFDDGFALIQHGNPTEAISSALDSRTFHVGVW